MKDVGFKYYKVDTDRYGDMRIRKLKRVHGTKGIAVYDYLLAQVYKVHGCFTYYDSECVFNLTDYFDISENTVKEIVNFCASVGLFDKGLLMRENVITSHAIQKRFAEMCIASRRLYVYIPKEILLIKKEEVNAVIKHQFFLKKHGVFSRESVEQNGGFEENSEETQETTEHYVGFEENSEETQETTEHYGGFEENSECDKRKERTKEKENESIKSKVGAYSKEYVSGSRENSRTPDVSSSSVPPVDKENFIDAKDEIEFDEIVEFWNATTGGVFGKLICIDKSRAKMTRARIIDHGKDSFFQAIRNAAESVFLRSVTWFSYDWMIRPNNFIKVLEGRYSNRETQNTSGCVTENGKEKNVKPVRQRVYD